ncbi:beta-galactosidase [Streptomyces sp. NPDC058486]|uniref:beta-galactosidase n=1 Tax=unclassified Streptomyces TaxID=2593676 RepID=UPI003650D19B
MTARRRTRLLVLLGVLAAVLALVLTALLVPPRGDPPPYLFGTLQTDPARARTEHEHGVRVAHMEIHWDRFEPEDGVYDSGYIEQVREELRVFHAAGAKVEVSLGLHHPPAWLFEQYPSAVLTDQHGGRTVEVPNIVFSESVRDEAARYVSRVMEETGPEEFWAVRVGVSETGEFAYPSPAGDPDTGGDPAEEESAYWAYDANAQGDESDRPPGVPASPLPGWRPGDRDYRGDPVTTAQVTEWYDWYLGALADAVNWQTLMYRSLGFDGIVKVLVPGSGYFPADHRAAIRARLDTSVTTRLMARGAGFFLTVEQVRKDGEVHIVPTSLVDGTGAPRDSGCEPRDAAVDVRAPDSSVPRTWSSVRWVTAIAVRNGFPVSGESAGPQVEPYRPGVMEQAARQMRSCGLEGLMWAFDENLYDGTPGSSLQDYARVIEQSQDEGRRTG